MEEAEDNMSSDDVRKTDSSTAVKKPKKRSLVERELETSLTARVTSPASVSDGLSTSRYGRARRLKTETELIESQKALLASIKSPGNEKTPVKVQSPTYRMHASNSPQKAETPKKPPASHLENQIDNIFQENASLSRFSEDTGTPSPAKKFPKVYIRKDLIQNREEDEPIMLISNLFSPTNSAAKSSGNNSVKSLEKYNVKQNGHVDNSSVVKTLDFDSNKKKKKDDKDKEQKPSLSKNELFEIEAKCPYQLGDLAWARMGTFPFWPCIVTRDPHSEMFVKKKLFGRVEHDIIHVTFFGDNGRRSWIVDNMLRKYLGLLEFETTREKFTPEDKKKDPRFYAAFFVSDKKQALWNTSVEEADSLLREPKRLRIDIFNDMLWKSRLAKKNPKSGKIMSRTDSDVSLSESLYDSLFSEQEVKTDDAERSKNRSRNKSFDVSEVVTACLDNMAAKTGITKIQRQSHMDRWLQKAKSKTPEKIQAKPVSLKIEKPDKKPVQDSKVQGKTSAPIKLNRNRSVSKTTKQSTGTPPIVKPYRFRRRTNSNPTQTETKESSKTEDKSSGNINSTARREDTNSNSLDVIANVHNNKQMIEDNSFIIIEKDPITQITENLIQDNTNESNSADVIQNKSHTDKVDERHEDLSMSICKDSSIVSQSINEVNIKEANKTGYEVSNFIEEVKQTKSVNDKIEDTLQEKIDILSTNDKILHTEVVAQPENMPNIKTEYKEISAWSKEQTDNIEVISAENNLSDVLKVTCSGKTITCMESQDVTLNFPEQINPKQKVLDSIMIKEQNSSENNDSKAQNMDINNICPLDKHSKEMFIEDSSVMEVDDDDKTLNNQTEVANLSQLVRNAAMEVDEDANFEAQTNGNRCPKFETVSNKCVEDNDILMACTDTNLKDARNVTIEVSVTEKKNDDTLNNQLHEEPQGSIGNQKPQYQDIETNIFLDVCHSHKKNMVKTKDAILGHRNSSTPEKYEGLETLNSISSNTCIKKLNLDTTINVNASNNIQKELVEHVDDSNKSDIENKQKQNNETVDDITIIHEDSFDNNVLNESTQSDSILQCTYDDVAENDARLNDSNKSETILKLIESNPSVYKNASLVDVTSKNEVNCVAEENHEIVTRQNVESPTFTQLLDSEEFFRDVNESKPSPPKPDTVQTLGNEVDSESVKQNTNLDQTSRNKAEKYMKSIGTDKVAEKIEDDSEEVSDDEPSPEYESLDEEITEDFRKHMMSIESNIKDKKDEEQIVKICNEIAEKAKLSPPKYILDGQMPTHNKLDTKSKIMPIINLNDKLEIDTTSADKMHMKPDNKNSQDKIYSSFEKQKEPKTCTEKQSRILKNIKIDKHNISKRHDHIKTHTEETRVNIDGDSKLKVITDDNKPKIIYRTRRNMSNAIRDRASPGLKIEASKIEQYRRSAEYDPKVLLIRLERDASDCAKDTKSSKFLEDKSIDNKTITTLKQVSADLKHTEIKIKAIDNDKNIKSRLSLKRDSPRSKQPENKIMTEESKTLIRESLKKDEMPTNEPPKELIFEQSKKEEIVISNLEVKKIHIENISKETKIPEGIKVNGYFHNIDRKFTETPDSGDTDFDIDAVSLNSEDSEISLPNSVESIPKRNLRSRPERTLENALRNPEFLKYLELKQDYLMDEHPELNEDEVIMYVYKTWQYEEDLKSDIKKIEDARHSNLIKCVKGHETPRSNKKKSQPKNNIENYFREKYEKSRKTIDFASESGCSAIITCETNVLIEQKPQSDVPVQSNIDENMSKTDISVKRKTRSKSPQCIDLISENSNDAFQVNITKYPSNEAFKTNESTISIKVEENVTPKRSSRRSKTSTPKSLEKEMNTGVKSVPYDDMKKEIYIDTESIDSEDSEIPLRKLRSKVIKENTIAKELQKQITLEKKEDEVMKEDVTETKVSTPINQVKEELDETASTVSDNEPLFKQKKKRPEANSMEDPEFLKYLELKQDSLMDENPQLSQDEVVSYLFKTWLYEENSKSELVKNCESEQANLIKGLNNNGVAPAKKVKRKAKVDKHIEDSEVIPKEKPRRRIVQPFYNENYSDIEDELELFEIFKTKKSAITVVSKSDTHKDKIKSPPLKSMKEDHKDTPDIENKSQENNIEEIQSPTVQEDVNDVEYVDETEIYFTDLTKPKPNVFKGLAREKVCEICEYAGHLVKCKGCNGMFHPDCVKKESEAIEKEKQDILPLRGRKKKIKKPVRKTKSLEDSGSHSDERQDASADVSMEDLVVPEITFDAENFESQIELKMKEILDTAQVNYDSYSSDDGIDWRDSEAGKCEIIDVKWKRKDAPIDYSDFKCYNCQKYDVPICFVCKNAVSKTGVKMRQKCHVAHCHKYYHLECLDHWPQTQFNSGEPSRSNKKINEFFEAMTCPRHVCHTCVSDDPRGCKTRFSGDKLAKCVRCPATYHSFNKCLPAGSQVLTASHIICPRHCDQRPGKVPCHVNTGWCFICALGGSLICCEYCPTSFHAECLNIKPPEGNYMCEDCETGRLPLYGEMVWVKLGHYRWWPGIILHPSEIPDNIMAVKHEPGDFVVRFFGQYDHYWVNRGRVFPYQEGDSGRISSQKSKINEDFICAMEHAQRAYNILKNADPDEEESLDIESSLLPPHYVKLKCNKPCGSLCGRKMEDPSLSLTQCECNPDEPDPCGPYSQCLNRMLLTECGPTCRAGERCMNRAFEKRQYPKLVPYRTPHRGWGLKTLENIKAGQFVIEYVGELIDEEEFRRRMRRKHEIRDENFYFLTLDKERMIDAGPKGNVARFMNHCCEPNCETQKWTVLGDIRVGLFAIDDIPANSEVTFNYNLECAGIEKKRCLCGAKRCSGYIGAKPKQDESQLKKIKRPYNKKKKPEESPSTSKVKTKRLGRPPKPKELTELEKDVLIIKNATSSISSDESSRTLSEDKIPKPLKRKRVSNTVDEVSLSNGQESGVEERNPKALKKKRVSITTDEVSLSNGQESSLDDKNDKIPKALKRKRVSITNEEVSLSNGLEPSEKKPKCDEKPSEVGD